MHDANARQNALTPGIDGLSVLLAAVVLVLGAVGCYDSLAHPAAGSKRLAASYHPTLSRPLPEPFAGRDIVRVLIMGSDTRPHDVGRADTIMVLFVNPRLPRAAIVSIPRDLRVHIPGHGTDKINHSYAYGGVELTRHTVEELLGVEIPYYVRCDFDTFVKAVDLLGGVDIEVPDVEGNGRGMNYDDNWGNLHIHLKPGLQHLDGYQAMGFVRYRHGDSDFQRTKRQQEFLRALLAQKLKVKNLPQLLRAASFIVANLDTNISWRDAVDFLRVAKNLKPADLFTETIPIRDMTIGGIYYAGLRESAFRELMSRVRAHLAGASGEAPEVVVLNGCGVAGIARQASQRLESSGWTVRETGNADSYDYERSVVEYPPGAEGAAERIAQELDIEQPRLTPNEAGLDSIRVILGHDYVENNAIDEGE